MSISRVPPIPSKPVSIMQTQNLQRLAGTQITQQQNAPSPNDLTNPNFNPLAIARRFTPLNERLRRQQTDVEKQKTEEKGEADQENKVLEVEKLDKVSEYYQRKNPEFQDKDLVKLRERIKNTDTKEDILRKVLEAYPDYTLADEALDFLLETTESTLYAEVKAAKDELNTLYEREIKAGKNIAEEVKDFSQKGLGSPTQLRDMYRDITGNPRDTLTMFDELSAQYSFEQMQPVIHFLLQSLGTDLKSKGPSISRAELHRLLADTRALQAVLGIYLFFKMRMRLIFSAFRRHELIVPSRLTFEKLAKSFVRFLQERYPSIDKALKIAVELGISEEIIAQIIIYTQLKDGVRQVSPRLFRSDQHKQDILTTFLQLIEELDEQLEEEMEEEEEEEEENKEEEEKKDE